MSGVLPLLPPYAFMVRIHKHLPLTIQVSDNDLVPTKFGLIPSALPRPDKLLTPPAF
jgi:hypothetical protein